MLDILPLSHSFRYQHPFFCLYNSSSHTWTFFKWGNELFENSKRKKEKIKKRVFPPFLTLLSLWISTACHIWLLELILLLKSLSAIPRHLLPEFTPFIQPRLTQDTVWIKHITPSLCNTLHCSSSPLLDAIICQVYISQWFCLYVFFLIV